MEYNEILIHVDYCKNYQCQQKNEILSADFGHKSFSLLTAFTYLRLTYDNEMSYLLITIIIEASDKTQVKSLTCFNKNISHVKLLIGNTAENFISIHLKIYFTFCAKSS